MKEGKGSHEKGREKGTGEARLNDARNGNREKGKKRLAEKKEGDDSQRGNWALVETGGRKRKAVYQRMGQRARRTGMTTVSDAGATTTERHALGRPATCYETTLSDERQYSPTLGTT